MKQHWKSTYKTNNQPHIIHHGEGSQKWRGKGVIKGEPAPAGDYDQQEVTKKEQGNTLQQARINNTSAQTSHCIAGSNKPAGCSCKPRSSRGEQARQLQLLPGKLEWQRSCKGVIRQRAQVYGMITNRGRQGGYQGQVAQVCGVAQCSLFGQHAIQLSPGLVPTQPNTGCKNHGHLI
jgi:hypothetical protein